MRISRTRRRRLLLVGLAPLLLAVVFATHVAFLYLRSDAGYDALARGDSDDARRSYGANNTSLNHLERWVAPYDEGVAAYGQDDQAAAVALFTAALADAPLEEECRVRTNLGLATEALADQLPRAEQGQARLLLREARLAIAPCIDPELRDELPERTDDEPAERDAEALAALPEDARVELVEQDVRLVDKLLDAAAEELPDPDRQVTGRDVDFEDLTPQEQQEILEQRNDKGREKRKREQASRNPLDDPPPPKDQRIYNW